MSKVAVIGMGYVGIPAAALIADVDGFEVTGIQRRSKRSGWKIDILNKGENPIGGNEPGLSELIERVVKQKKTFSVTDDMSILKDMDYILIDVQTPTDKDHIPRYESLREVSKQVGEYLQKDTTVIIESTCAPGTTNYIVKPIIEEASGLEAGKDFYLVFSYERVMVGRLIYNIVNYKRIVGGLTPKGTEKAMWLYKHIVKEELLPTDAITSEVAKVVENTYRDVNIAFANEVALACESLGVDITEVRKFVNSLPVNSNAHRNMHISGAGVGGHCLPKDPWLLQYGVSKYGKRDIELKVIQNSRFINDFMPHHMIELLESALEEAGKNIKKNLKIAVLGVAFLENSDDPRNTPTYDLVKALENKGYEFKIHDHFVRQEEFEYEFSSDLDQVLNEADAILIMTKHSVYENLSFDKLKSKLKSPPIIIDGRHIFDLQTAKSAGFIFRGVGKPY